MTIRKILGEHGPMEKPCTGGACPAAIAMSDGNIYVQGYVPSEEASAAMTLPQGEAAVMIPLPVIKRIAAQIGGL